ncbi:hypothetical protein B0H19DRAFT_1269219 [Mycena capillaripes]|nr:hypothetical protein B0H19DRAFT_1269219 [Mycena capillaripes]
MGPARSHTFTRLPPARLTHYTGPPAGSPATLDSKSCPPAPPVLPKGAARHVMDRPFYDNRPIAQSTSPAYDAVPAQPSPFPHCTLNSTPAGLPSRNLPLPINHAAAIKIFGSATLLIPPPSRTLSPATASSGATPPQRSCPPSLSDAAQPSPPKLRRLPRIITDINLMTISTTFLILKLYS